MISLIFSLLFPVPTFPERVAVEAAYVVTTYTAPKSKCCGLCKNGKIKHGDGHVTDCACPPGCLCKTKSVLVPSKECKTCVPSK
jgi:hypothetical protein